jgi:hypothetical protein
LSTLSGTFATPSKRFLQALPTMIEDSANSQLAEQKAADKKLTEIAESAVNAQASAA